jgi:hypothetical protein
MQEIRNSGAANFQKLALRGDEKSPSPKNRIFLKRHPEKRWLFQFSFNGKKYYSINDRNVVRLPPYEPLRRKLNSIIAGNTEAFDGHYCRETKALAIIAAGESL